MNRRIDSAPYDGPERRKIGDRREWPEPVFDGPEQRIEPYPVEDRIAWLRQIDEKVDRRGMPLPAAYSVHTARTRLGSERRVNHFASQDRAQSMANHPAGKGRTS